MTQPGAEVESFILEGLDWATPCYGRPGIEECDKTAERYQKLSCGCDRLACEPHAKWRRDHPGLVFCGTCSNVNHPKWIRVVIDEPL